MKNNTFKVLVVAAILLTVGIYMGGCTKNKIKMTTTDDVNIVGYLDKHTDSFSLFREILSRTKTDAFLNAYGAYTCFAPTNSGVTAWLKTINASSVDAADLNTLKDMVKFHLMNDTITTSAFTDGKLGTVTMYGQYLITSVVQKEGASGFLVNRQGYITQSNIRVGNGIIHAIDNVLIPASLSLAKQLEANPNYSIFLQAVKATGYYDMLNTVNTTDTTKRWITLIAESNAALADSGITSYAQLQAKYSTSGNVTSLTDTLNLYIRYHIFPGLKFLGDLIVAPSQATLAPQEVVTTKLIDKDVYLNDDVFNSVHEQGVMLKRLSSDVQATNGVLHEVNSHFNIKFRKPFAIYWDVASFDEIRKLPAYYRKANYSFARATESVHPVKDIDWGWVTGFTYGLDYKYDNTYVNSDYLALAIGTPSDKNRPYWWDFTTPLIVKGKYKIWICYRQAKQSSSSNNLCNVYFDGALLQRPMNFIDTRPAGTDGDIEPIFYKRYTESTSNVWVGRLVGIVDVATTDRHVIRIEAIKGTQSANYLDMIHIIPADQNQILPRFKPDGSMLYL